MSINRGSRNVRPSDDGRGEVHLAVVLKEVDGLHACPIETIAIEQKLAAGYTMQPRKSQEHWKVKCNRSTERDGQFVDGL